MRPEDIRKVRVRLDRGVSKYFTIVKIASLAASMGLLSTCRRSQTPNGKTRPVKCQELNKDEEDRINTYPDPIHNATHGIKASYPP